MIVELVKFYEGGIPLEYAERMPVAKIFILTKEAGRINKQIKKGLE